MPSTRSNKGKPGLAAAAKAAKAAAPKPQGVSKSTKEEMGKEIAKLYARIGKLEGMIDLKKPGMALGSFWKATLAGKPTAPFGSPSSVC
jgi:hypothetical protein